MTSGFKFEFDERAFKKAVQKAAEEGLKDLTNQTQAKLDSVARTHRGRPPAEIAAHLARLFPGEPGKRNTAADWMEYAEAISAGTHIQVKPQMPRW